MEVADLNSDDAFTLFKNVSQLTEVRGEEKSMMEDIVKVLNMVFLFVDSLSYGC